MFREYFTEDGRSVLCFRRDLKTAFLNRPPDRQATVQKNWEIKKTTKSEKLIEEKTGNSMAVDKKIRLLPDGRHGRFVLFL